MKRTSILLASVVFTGLGTGIAFADCHDTSAAAGTDAQASGSVASADGEGVSKDGSTAPLENAANAAGVNESDGGTTTTYGEAQLPEGIGSSASETTGSTASSSAADSSATGSATGSDLIEGQASASTDTSGAATEDLSAGSSASADASGATDDLTGGASGSAGAEAGATGDLAASGEGVAKDGQTMPLADNQGGGDEQIAMSGQDVEAQQHGGATAASKALGECE